MPGGGLRLSPIRCHWADTSTGITLIDTLCGKQGFTQWLADVTIHARKDGFGHCQSLIIEYHLGIGLANSLVRSAARLKNHPVFKKRVFFEKSL
jgi:hypothetical protein